MLPIARWKGYGGETDFHGHSLETITWAVGLLGATARMTVFGTVHAPLFHPLIAAKELVTADHVGEGRLGLNLVVGWNEGEFEMFGVKQREHDVRYEFAQEWLDVVKQAWENSGEFDFDGQFLKLRSVRASPKPYGATRPLIMNAGSSGAGQAFALRNCDAFFVATAGSRTSLAANATKVAEVKGAARALGREIDVYTVGQVICRASQKEAQDYYQHALIDNADWGAIDGMLANKSITPQTLAPDEYAARRRYFAANAVGGYPFVGTPDHVAAELETISRAGVRGIALSFVNYLQELPYFCDEVLPRLARLGVRAGRASRDGRAP
jgi:alkanesulfonate monooxygenase SsuD/methylene tetrahydromethanopterin reductase-like flavin-dependent oxidoreductase (luciferase family)